MSERWRIVVDRDLCQGHGVCESEAPGVFDFPVASNPVVVAALLPLLPGPRRSAWWRG